MSKAGDHGRLEVAAAALSALGLIAASCGGGALHGEGAAAPASPGATFSSKTAASRVPEPPAGAAQLTPIPASPFPSGSATGSVPAGAPATAAPAHAAAVPDPSMSVSGVLLPPASAPPPRPSGTPAPAGGAQAAVVMDDASGALLLGGNEHVRLPVASLVKVATAVVAIERGDLDRVVDVDVDAWTLEVENDSAVMGLESGDRFRLRDLLYGMLLASGGDASLSIARAVAGNESAFVPLMNQLAARLGMRNTHFVDVDGITDAGQYSSAYDMALLARYAMTLPAFREIVASEQWVARGSRELELLNTNPLLGYTDGVDGVKTGFTDGAGRTFVATANRNGHRVFVVLLNDPYRARDGIALIEWAFSSHAWGT